MPREILEKYFGFAEFREGQEAAIESILAGADTLVVMPTGTGKSLCYQLPAMALPDLTLVVSPLIALMKDQVDFLSAKGIPATFVNSSIPYETQQQRLGDVTNGRVKILYIAPERFRVAGFRKILDSLPVSLLAIDEAHCISMWGHDFRPDYLLLKEVIAQLGHPTVAALTATATKRVQKDIVEKLGLKKVEKIVTGFNRPNLTFRVFHTINEHQKFSLMERFILPRVGSTIVYVGTRKQAEHVAQYINEELKIPALHYHAGLSDRLRTETQNKFMSDKVQVIVATNAFGMGVDKPDIRLVLHYAIPGTLEAYYQEAGRAGRDGRRSGCILFYDINDVQLQEWFIENDAPDYEALLSLHQKITKLSQNGRTRVSLTDLQNMLNLYDFQIRVGLRHLENADALSQLGESGGVLHLQVFPLERKKLLATARMIQERRQHKIAMLNQMIDYAESRVCRRQIILDHFGDRSKPEAILCCDNCERAGHTKSKKPIADVPQPKEADLAQAILRVVDGHWCAIGTTKVAQILGGSRAHAITRYGHQRSEFYNTFPDLQLTDIEKAIKQLVREEYLMYVYEGEYIVLNLTPRGKEALQGKRGLPSFHFAKKSDRVPSARITLKLFFNGMKPEEIAEHRGLAVGTIYSHLADAIEKGDLDVMELLPKDRLERIRSAIAKVGVERLSPIKDILPSSFTFDEIKLAVAYERWLRDPIRQDDSLSQGKKNAEQNR